MKKQKTLAVLLSAAMVAGAIPTAALAEVVGSNSDSGVKAAELSEDQEIEEQNEDSEDETGSGYVLMNVPSVPAPNISATAVCQTRPST